MQKPKARGYYVAALIALVLLTSAVSFGSNVRQEDDETLFLPNVVAPEATFTPNSTIPATPIRTSTATSTPVATRTPNTIPTQPPQTASEWSQHAHNAQHTSHNPVAVPTPWRWKWVWNGSTPSGHIAPGKFRLPRNSQPVTGAGRVFIAAGAQGVYALDNTNGAEVWNVRPGGNINSTPAFDADTAAVFVVSDNGTLYKLDAVTGQVVDDFATGDSNSLPLPPAIVADRVFFAMGNTVYAINKGTMMQIWRYDAEALVDTPPAYSPSRNIVLVTTNDLYVHAVDNGDGNRRWRVKPSVHAPGDPGTSADNQLAEFAYGWPVVAEASGLLLVKLRLDWQTLWSWNPWPGSNDTIRTNLNNRPDQQALMVLNLDDGTTAFVANIGHGGYGDGDYMPMGPQPVVKRFADGSEVAYVVMRASPCLADPCDGRWDSRLGEMMLNNSTVPGYAAGAVRFMTNSFFPTDEQAQLSMAGDDIFAAHWEAGIAHRIVDRSDRRGTADNPIVVEELPHIATSQDQDICNSGFNSSHYCDQGLRNTRNWPAGFYIYWNQGAVYDQYWSDYAMWTVSGNTIYFVGTDGSLVALENGTPTGVAVETAPKVLDTATHNTNQGTIYASQARAFAGRTMTVEGEISEIFNNGKAVYLTYHKPHVGHFLVRILKQDWSNFTTPPEERYTAGQRLRVTGAIEWYQGDPVIYVREPGQIEIMADALASTLE